MYRNGAVSALPLASVLRLRHRSEAGRPASDTVDCISLHFRLGDVWRRQFMGVATHYLNRSVT